MDLKGKLALVTGATSGIGLSIANTLAEAGCDIIINGLVTLGDEKTIQDIMESLKLKHKVNVEYIAADLRNVDEIKALTSQLLERHPAGVDILINNAGTQHFGSIEEFPEDQWDAIIAVNLTAPFHLIKQLLPTMKAKGWGRIVNMASANGRVATAKVTPYTAAKHGLIGLTKGVALEVGQYGITCNAVCPGLVDTPMAEKFMEYFAGEANMNRAKFEEEVVKSILTTKLITPEQVAELVLFLVGSGASDQMTGADYLMDYGHSAA